MHSHTKEPARTDGENEKRLRKVTKRIDFGQMRTRCLASIQDYHGEGEVVQTANGVYIFQDNGADILAVAHLDTVQQLNHFHAIDIDGDWYVYNGQLDDRLGAYLILDALPLLLGQGKYDVLLTEGEETGHSTAQFFKSPRQYKWMFSFDRAGGDVVTYQYDTQKLRDKLRAVGMTPSHGSFSDISYLSHLACQGINVGCGYHDNHGKFAHANLSTTVKQVNRFVQFYQNHKDEYLPHDPAEQRYGRGGNWVGYGDDYYDYGGFRSYGGAQGGSATDDPKAGTKSYSSRQAQQWNPTTRKWEYVEPPRPKTWREQAVKGTNHLHMLWHGWKWKGDERTYRKFCENCGFDFTPDEFDKMDDDFCTYCLAMAHELAENARKRLNGGEHDGQGI